MLDIQLKIFKTVAEKGSFSLAAQELHMTQSSVSQQIHNLENYYGVKLFDRMHRKILLTQAGAALYPYAMQLERLCYDARKTVQGLMNDISGRLHIGASLTIGEYLMPEILVEFNKRFPQVDIAMDIYNTEVVIAKVLAGSINLGFVEGPYFRHEAIVDQPCGGDQLVIVVPKDFQLSQDDIPLSRLLSEKWVMREANSGTRRIFEQFIVEKGYEPTQLNVVMELGSTQAIKEAVKAGVGIAAISCLTVRSEVKWNDVKLIQLNEGIIERNYTMLYLRDKFKTCAVEKFGSFVLDCAQINTK
ncbi:LysR family transcriptional regulator [Dendrosporobacter sp. 1207_IL3150]|uniref:LysR family transcriptional regulator n=1 Tax=Dendrosporobacter sp. 1207_IL3150 TaxID=3084054 RepID=UPI002FD9A665